ncbi:winged helix-turn-helix domain-containing protein [Kaarinaea lacus]
MEQQAQNGFLIKDWRVSPPEGTLSRDGETVRLEPKAMEVLVYFASRPNEVITREELERDVWRGAIVGYDAVTNTIIKLRKALQDSARQPEYIATIPKRGYQLIAAISYPEDVDSSAPEPAKSPESAGSTDTSGSSEVTETSDTSKTVGSGQAQASSNKPLSNKELSKKTSSNKTGLAIAALFAVVVLSLIVLWPQSPEMTDTASTPDTVNKVAIPSIVVLPFEFQAGDTKQENIADGITEDIITDLSRLSNLLVISSNTSNRFKGQQVSPQEVGADLKVGYVLKGSIRRIGEDLRVNAQLVNTSTGFNVWAERYDRKTAEVFAVQNELTQSIVKALTVKLTSQEKQQVAQRATDSLKAYDYFQEGQRFGKAYSKEGNIRAREMFREAIALDPGYGRAYGAMAVTLAFDFQRGWTDSPGVTIDRALELAKKAVSLNDAIPQTYWALGFIHLWRKEYEEAEKAVTKAIDIAPNYADGYGLLSLINTFAGKPKKAIELNDKAISLNPYYTFEYLISYGLAYYTLGDYETAITNFEQAQSRNTNATRTKVYLAACYVRVGRQEEAEWLIDEIRILNPTATITGLEKVIPIANSDVKNGLLEDLRKAGLPE